MSHLVAVRGIQQNLAPSTLAARVSQLTMNGGKPFGKNYGKGKSYGKPMRYGKGKGYGKGSWFPRRFGKGKGFGKYGGKGKHRYFSDQYFSHGPKRSLNISDVKEFPSQASSTTPRTSATTTYHRLDAGDDLLARDNTIKLLALRRTRLRKAPTKS